MADNCLFCKIVDGAIPSEKLFEDDRFIAFRDINPQSRVHILVVPKRHIAKLSDCLDSDDDLLSGLLLTANKVARDEGIVDSGYRVVINSGKDGGQLVFHIHLHLMGGEKLGGKMG